MSLRAVIYARVSTDIQRENYSIPSQIKACLDYAKQKGYSLVGDKYVDPETGRDVAKGPDAIPAYVDNFSGLELNRPSLDEAYAYLRENKYDVLIVHAIDRLSRDGYNRVTIERDFAAQGARVEFVLRNYEDTPEGEVQKDMEAAFAKWENAKRVERSNRGKRRKAETGKFVGGIIPFGYRVNPDAFGGLEVYEPEARIIRRIFGLFVEGRLSLYRVVEEMNKQGAKTYYENSMWARSTVSKMLKNTAYAGYVYYNRRKRTGKKSVMRDESEWIKIDVTPIIDPITFETAQELLKHNRDYARRLPKRFYLLTGMVVCSNCGKAYTTQTAKAGINKRANDNSIYRHRAKMGACCNKTISGRVLEGIVWDAVKDILLDPASLHAGYEQNMEQERAKQGRKLKHLETLQAEIEKRKKTQAKLLEAYTDPDTGIEKEMFLEMKAKIDRELKEAREQADLLAGEIEHIPTPEDLKSLEEFAAKVGAVLGQGREIPPEDKRQIMQMLNLKVIISPEGDIRLDGWFAPPTEEGLSSKSS